MSYVIVGLGNPGEKYGQTRHNIGRVMVDSFAQKQNFSQWDTDKKSKSLISEGVVQKENVILLLPEAYMNKSGLSVKPFITSKKKAEQLIVVYDDLDLPLGAFKISFGRGSGGHRGLESIIRSVKTKDFIRVRIGITQATPGGKLKKPKGDKKVLDFILGDFKKGEQDGLKKVSKKVIAALEVIVKEGRQRAMNEYN